MKTTESRKAFVNKIAQFEHALGEDKEYWNVRKPILRSIGKTIEKELRSI